MTEHSHLIDRAWATPWEDEAVYGVVWRTLDGHSGAFAAGTKEDAERIAREIVGNDPESLEGRYERRMQNAAKAAQDYGRRKLLGLDHILDDKCPR